MRQSIRNFQIVCLVLIFVFLNVIGRSETAPNLTPPAGRAIKVAFLIGPGATMIDFTGPWEVFQDVMLTKSGKAVTTHEAAMSDDVRSPFELYVVSEKKEVITVSAGMQITPNYTFADAPQPDVIVIPAHQASNAELEWLKKVAPRTDVTMSVCAGAGILAKTGLLDGLQATTHHWFVDYFNKTYPAVKFVKGERFVEHARYSTAAGLTSGIDMAMRVVERYFGHDVAETTAQYMEYHSPLWNPAK
jgi:transcriptional regulator GlxA family with amidase domain